MANRQPAARTRRDRPRHRAGGKPAVEAQRAANRDRQPGPDLPWPDAEDVTTAPGFTDFDPPAAPDTPTTPPPPARPPPTPRPPPRHSSRHERRGRVATTSTTRRSSTASPRRTRR